MSTTATKRTKQPTAPQVTKAAAWSKLGIHTVTLPSTAVVKIRIPDLTLLLAAGAVPEDLRLVAFEEIRSAIAAETAAQNDQPLPAQEVDEARLNGMAQLHRYLVSMTLVDPQLSAEELESSSIPAEDLLMLTQFASRQRNTDARGVVLGAEPVNRWELWREKHKCAEDCTACSEVLNGLSTTGFIE